MVYVHIFVIFFKFCHEILDGDEVKVCSAPNMSLRVPDLRQNPFIYIQYFTFGRVK